LSQTKLCAKNYHDWAVLHCQKLEIQLPNQLQCFLPLLKGLLQKHKEQRLTSVVEAKHCLNMINLL
ncbi:MAG: protein kinase, partial [Acinetobacter sp.]